MNPIRLVRLARLLQKTSEKSNNSGEEEISDGCNVDWITWASVSNYGVKQVDKDEKVKILFDF